MSTRHARRIEDEPAQVTEEKAPAQGPSTAEEYLAAVNELLDNTSSTWAQRVAAEGHARFPDHPELERLCRLLTPRPARSVPSNGRKKVSHEKAFRWLNENEIHHRGEWVALNGDGFLTSAPTWDELKKKIEPIDPEDPPLVHH